MTLVIQETKTHAGTRKLPMTADVEQCFRAIIEDRPTPRIERMVDGRSGFLFLDKDCLPEVAMHTHSGRSMCAAAGDGLV